MPIEIYKIIHLVGIVMTFSGLVGLLTLVMSGSSIQGKVKTLIYISHGLGLLLVLFGGFGLLAKLGLAHDIPGWVYAKLLIWLILGGAVALIKRKGQIGWTIFISLIALFTVAAYLAIFKPF